MLINKEEADKRLNSSSNLLNRLRSNEFKSNRSKAMQLFGVGIEKDAKVNNLHTFVNPFQPQAPIPVVSSPTILSSGESTKEILPIEEVDAREKLERVQHEALNTLMSAIKETQNKMSDLSAAKAADVAAKMGKIVDSIRSDKSKSRESDKQVHLHFYTPEPRKIEEFEVIDV